MFDLARAVRDRLRHSPVTPWLAELSVLEIQAVLTLAEEISTNGQTPDPNALLHHTHDPDPESGICRKHGCHAVDYAVYQRHQDDARDRENRDYQHALGRRPRW